MHVAESILITFPTVQGCVVAPCVDRTDRDYGLGWSLFYVSDICIAFHLAGMFKGETPHSRDGSELLGEGYGGLATLK